MIYGWSPTIGDPDTLGWVTVIGYLATAALAFLSRARFPVSSRPRLIWTALVVILLFLAVNKQLDLQSLGTAVMRHLAQGEGWYSYRREAQAVFIVMVAAIAFTATIGLVPVARRVDGSTALALVGLVILLAFVAVRAVSFHHVDALIGHDFGGVRVNHLFELGGISVIAIAAVRSILAARSTVQP